MSMRALFLILPLALAGCVTVDPAMERAAIEDRAAALEIPVGLTASFDGDISEDEAVALAIAENPRLAADLAEAGLARAEWASAVLPPNLIAELTWFNPEGAGAVLDADIRAPIAAIIGWPQREAAARARYDAAQSRALLRLIDFSAEVRLAWVEAVAARERANMYARILQSAEAALLLAEEIDAQGNAPGLDLTRQQVNALAARAAAEDAEQAAQTARIRLETLLTRPVDLPGRLPTEMADMAGTDRALSAALEASLPLAAARADAEAAAQSAGYTNIESLFHGELGPAFDIEDGDTETGVSAHVDVPVNGFGHPQRAAARIRAQQAADRLAALEDEISADIELALLEMNRAGERATMIREEWLPASTLALEQTMQQYNGMQIGVYALLDAFNAQVEAGRAWVDTLERYHRARIALMSLMQGGSPMGMAASQDLSAATGGGDH
ncbi:TolC family protein [Hyphobacterium sp. HN65]|uniref:TolC family protein n=1 Tax=Hyphobacterium lacteum TaxID=3116575 RepID=A0ABU7LTT0_9PROT|nr:TolC family protein [Hyphobacterium sp. HN65]MEE2527330.1 TolC family protein [Hyphobacterium sp. HN65]